MRLTFIDGDGKVQTYEFNPQSEPLMSLLFFGILMPIVTVSDAEVIVKTKGSLPPEVMKKVSKVLGEKGEKGDYDF